PAKKVASINDLLRNADFGKDAPAIDEGKGAERAARGEFLWLQYLSKTKEPQLKDAPVQKALEDFKKAAEDKETPAEAAASALVWQGHIHETMKNRDEAARIYKQGAERF